MHARIHIVDDERALVEGLEYALQREGFGLTWHSTGQQALTLAASSCTDLILLDLMLADIAGIQVCLQLHADPATRAVPIIMMTTKAAEVDRVVGFEVGADDYVVKPFSVRELLLRIRAVLRRRALAPPSAGVVEFGRLRVDTDAHTTWVDGAEIVLTALEFRLLLRASRTQFTRYALPGSALDARRWILQACSLVQSSGLISLSTPSLWTAEVACAARTRATGQRSASGVVSTSWTASVWAVGLWSCGRAIGSSTGSSRSSCCAHGMPNSGAASPTSPWCSPAWITPRSCGSWPTTATEMNPTPSSS
jgi:DNA-binding response OmpR family regulator